MVSGIARKAPKHHSYVLTMHKLEKYRSILILLFELHQTNNKTLYKLAAALIAQIPPIAGPAYALDPAASKIDYQNFYQNWHVTCDWTWDP